MVSRDYETSGGGIAAGDSRGSAAKSPPLLAPHTRRQTTSLDGAETLYSCVRHSSCVWHYPGACESKHLAALGRRASGP